MAIVKLKDVAVTRLNNTGNGVKVVGSNENGGKTYKTSYMLWFKEPSGLSVGDVISASGFLSAKVGDPWTGDDGQERRSVELSLNSPRVETGDGQASQQVASAPAADQRATPGQANPDAAQGGFSFEDRTPF